MGYKYYRQRSENRRKKIKNINLEDLINFNRSGTEKR